MNEPRNNMKSRWSLKYKRSINCSNPKGFSQKNYCKRQKRGGKYKTFRDWMEQDENNSTPEVVRQNSLNLLTNREKTLVAFGMMEGEHVLRLKGNLSVQGAIQWLDNEPDGQYVVYGDGGFNRYFVYPDGSIKFSAAHAMHPSKQTIKKAKDFGFNIS